ncbi:MAG: hypothetical protein LC746_15940 [Acidobacteria bacterium]|nr:hypothetical protein [Acidobacteriota bacterium]
MSEQQPKPDAVTDAPDAQGGAARDLDLARARLAYSIIKTLLEHTRVSGDLIALMAQALDRDTLEALTSTPHWTAYLDTRRTLERAREDLEKFAAALDELGGEES